MTSCEKVQDNSDAGVEIIPILMYNFIYARESDHSALPVSLHYGWGRFGWNLRDFLLKHRKIMTALNQATFLDCIEIMTRRDTSPSFKYIGMDLMDGPLGECLLLQDFSNGFRKVFQNCDVVSVVAGVRELCEQQESSLVIKKGESHFPCAHTSPQLCALPSFLR